MPNNSLVVLFAIGFTVIVVGGFSFYFPFDIPISLLAGLAVFAFLYSLSELFDREISKSIIMFLSVFLSVVLMLAVHSLKPDSKAIEDWVNSVTIVSLGMTIYTLALKDLIKANKEKRANKSS